MPVHRNVVGDTTIYFIYGLPMTVIEFADDSIKTTILGREPSKGQVSAHVIKKNTYFSRFIASEGEPGTLMFTYAGFINVPGGNQKTERATKEGLRKEYPRTPESEPMCVLTPSSNDFSKNQLYSNVVVTFRIPFSKTCNNVRCEIS